MFSIFNRDLKVGPKMWVIKWVVYESNESGLRQQPHAKYFYRKYKAKRFLRKLEKAIALLQSYKPSFKIEIEELGPMCSKRIRVKATTVKNQTTPAMIEDLKNFWSYSSMDQNA